MILILVHALSIRVTRTLFTIVSSVDVFGLHFESPCSCYTTGILFGQTSWQSAFAPVPGNFLYKRSDMYQVPDMIESKLNFVSRQKRKHTHTYTVMMTTTTIAKAPLLPLPSS